MSDDSSSYLDLNLIGDRQLFSSSINVAEINAEMVLAECVSDPAGSAIRRVLSRASRAG